MANANPEASPFSQLPEECIASIISFTSPKDACRAAAVSLGFKSAAESDTVWDHFLPPDYRGIVEGSGSTVAHSTKKELFLLLCDSNILLDGGKLSFRLSRSTGKKCYMLCAKELQIAWKDTPMYWKWTSLSNSRFAQVAQLLSVFWLDISGTFQAQMLSPKTKYAAYLVFNLSENHVGFDSSSKASVKFLKESATTEIEGEPSTVYIVEPTYGRVMGHRPRRVRMLERHVDGRGSRSRTDGWLEIELGEFSIGEGDEGDIHARLSETERLDWKRGLIVEGIELRPKENV